MATNKETLLALVERLDEKEMIVNRDDYRRISKAVRELRGLVEEWAEDGDQVYTDILKRLDDEEGE